MLGQAIGHENGVENFLAGFGMKLQKPGIARREYVIVIGFQSDGMRERA